MLSPKVSSLDTEALQNMALQALHTFKPPYIFQPHEYTSFMKQIVSPPNSQQDNDFLTITILHD